MRLKALLFIAVTILYISSAQAGFFSGSTSGGSGSGVQTASDCDVAAYYAIGTLCQDTDDGKLYKGTGAAVVEITAGVGIAADGSVPITGVLVPDGDNTRDFGSVAATWATIYATTFSGALSGNATTATALAANPDDCAAGQLATGIAANGNLTCSATPSLQALTLTGANSLGLGSYSGGLVGSIGFKNGADSNDFTISAGATGADIGWTLPTAAPGGANYLLNVDADGTMGYTDPTTFQAAGAKLTAIQNLASASGYLKNDGSGNFSYDTPDGAGDVSKVGTPSNHQWAFWTGNGTLAGVSVTASKPVCSDANGDPVVCAGTEGVWSSSGHTHDYSATFAPLSIKGTLTNTKWCTTDGTAINCTSNAPQAALTNPVTGVASPTAGYLTKWGPSGNTIVDGPKIGTFTDSKWCSFSTVNGLACTENSPGVPTTITVADTADTTTFVALFEDATGDKAPKTDAGITYNASNGMLTVTGLTTGAGGITTASSDSPTDTFLDTQAPGADKEIAKIVGGYVDGDDEAENGTLDLYAHEAGTSTSYATVDGKNTKVKINKKLETAADIELGHASDTTLARSAAGAVTVEGKAIVLIGGTLVTRTEFIPVGWMIDGAVAPAAIATTDLGTRQVKTRAFQGATADQDLEMFWQAPNDIADGDAADGFQVKWRPIFVITSATTPAAGEGVAFTLQSCSSGNGDTGDCTVGTASVIADADLDAHMQFDVVYGGWTEMTVTDGAASEAWFMKLYRDQDNAIDDYAQPVGLIGIELKYQTKPLNDY